MGLAIGAMILGAIGLSAAETSTPPKPEPAPAVVKPASAAKPATPETSAPAATQPAPSPVPATPPPSKPAEPAKSSEAKPPAPPVVKPVEPVKPVAAKPSPTPMAKPTEPAKTVGPAAAKPAEAKPAGAKPAVAKPAEAKPAAPKPAAPTPAQIAAALFTGAPGATPETPIDKLVREDLKKIGVEPVLCSDAVFVRRVYLDVIGTLPSAAEAMYFIQDKDPNKRAVLIDRLLEREEYSYFWAMKWGDLLRLKAEFPVNLWPNAVQAYHRWIRESLRDNKPYDQFVRELLTSNGSNFRVGPVNFYRALPDRSPEGIASTVALTFMGARASAWDTNLLSRVGVFFSQIRYKPSREWKEEIVFWDPDIALAEATQAAAAASTNPAPVYVVAPPPDSLPIKPAFPDGSELGALPGDRDPREFFADWLITPENPWFAASMVNRMWSWLLGRGIVHEPDDIRPDNPPANPGLLDYLRKDFIAQNYDMKHMFRRILNSRTYQSTSLVGTPPHPEAMARFAFYPLRQLDAEVMIDAINRITQTSDLYTSAIPEPFTFIPDNQPAIALADGSITSSFLELFGRPARATGMENERANRASPSQRMHLLNSSHIQQKIDSSGVLKTLMDSKRKPEDIIRDMYLTVLSRFPSPEESRVIEAYAKTGAAKGREVWVDLVWALINSDEFRHRH